MTRTHIAIAAAFVGLGVTGTLPAKSSAAAPTTAPSTYNPFALAQALPPALSTVKGSGNDATAVKEKVKPCKNKPKRSPHKPPKHHHHDDDDDDHGHGDRD